MAALRAAGPPPPTAATDATPGSPGAELCESGSESESEEQAEEAGSQPVAGQAEGPPRTPNVQGMGGDEAPLEGAATSSLTPNQGAVRIQAAVRGWLARRRVVEAWRQELEFLGMLPLVSPSVCCPPCKFRSGVACLRWVCWVWAAGLLGLCRFDGQPAKGSSQC